MTITHFLIYNILVFLPGFTQEVKSIFMTRKMALGRR